MKARITIIVMLMSMFIGSLEASGQSARRGNERESARKSSSTVQREARKATPSAARAARGSSSSRTTAVERQTRSSNRSSANRMRSDSRNRTVHASRNHNPGKARSSGRNDRMVSKSTRNNPRSTYGTSNRTVHVGKTYKDPRQSTPAPREVRRGHGMASRTTVYRKDYYYPRKSVKVHVHPRTYHGHYKVLYYPGHREIVWTRPMYRYYAGLYPGYTWHYNWGYRIRTISVFDAKYNVGEISRIYGRVYGTWYNRDTDDLLLFFGGEYPYQDFTLVVPGRIARRYAWRPERYFLGQHIVATGLITSFEGKAEMVIKKKKQLDVY